MSFLTGRNQLVRDWGEKAWLQLSRRGANATRVLYVGTSIGAILRLVRMSCARFIDFPRCRLLPGCYQDRTTHPHLAPRQGHPVLWFLVGLGCLRLEFVKFVNRRSVAHKAPTAGGNTRTNYHREKDLEFESVRANLLFDTALGYAPAVGTNRL